LRAIEDGRFADLPHGVYGRAAIRAYAVGLGLPPDEIVSACEPLLPAVDDPIAALCRLRGIRSPASRKPRVKAPGPVILGSPSWQLAAAAAFDALVVVAMVLTVVAGTVTTSGLPVSSLGRAAAPAFGVIGVVLWGCYLVLFGGIAGATVGQRIVGVPPRPRDARPPDLRLVAARALQCACRDVSFIELLGGWLATFTARGRTLPDGTSALGRTDTRPC
jgi:hypothetical protein